MNENYFYAHIEGEVKGVTERIIIGQLFPCFEEDCIMIGNVKVKISKISFIQKIPKNFVDNVFSKMKNILEECKEKSYDNKKCMSSMKKYAKKAFEFPKEPSYVIISESDFFGKTIDIFFMQGLE